MKEEIEARRKRLLDKLNTDEVLELYSDEVLSLSQQLDESIIKFYKCNTNDPDQAAAAAKKCNTNKGVKAV